MSPLIASGVVIVVTLLVYKLFFGRVHNLPSYYALPGPKNKFGTFIGDLPFRPFSNQHRHFEKAIAEYGPVVRRRVIFRDVVILADPALAEAVLKDREFFADRAQTGLTYSLPRGIIGLPIGEDWKVHRRGITSGFSDRYLRFYSKIFYDKVELMIELLNEHAADKPLDIHEYISKMALDVIGLAGFGFEFDSLRQDENNKYMKAIRIVGDCMVILTMMPAWFVKLFYPSQMKELDGSLLVFEDVVKKIIATAAPREEARTMLENLQDHNLSVTDIVQELITLILAGHETTAHTLGWCFHLLANNPDVQAKAQKEIDDAFDEGLDMSNFFDVRNKFRYLNAIFHEALRLYPTIPLLPRVASAGAKIGEHDIPAGTNVMISLFAMGRSERNWEDPEAFKPERFLDMDVDADRMRGFSPFGDGPRVCPGRRFAQLEAIMVLTTVLRQFTVMPDPTKKIEEHSHITLGSSTGIWVKLVARQ